MSKTKSASSGTPYLNPNDITASRSAGPPWLPTSWEHLPAELVDVDAGGVDHHLGLGAQVAQQGALGEDPVEQPALRLERVRPAHALEATDEGLVGGVEEDEVRTPAAVAKLGEGILEVGEEPAGPDVDHRGEADVDALRPRLGDEVGGRHEELRGQVVDDIPALVLHDVGRGGAAGATHARDDEDLTVVALREVDALDHGPLTHRPLLRRPPRSRRSGG